MTCFLEEILVFRPFFAISYNVNHTTTKAKELRIVSRNQTDYKAHEGETTVSFSL